MLALLKKRGSSWFVPMLWALVGFALVSVGLAGLYGIRTSSKLSTNVSANTSVLSAIAKSQSELSQRLPPPAVTPENAESKIRGWLEGFGYGLRRVEDPKAYWEVEVTSSSNNVKFLIARSRKLDRYVLLQAGVIFEGDKRIAMLSRERTDRLVRALRAEMLRFRIDYEGIQSPLKRINLTTRIPITDQLTEDTFMGRVDEITFAQLLAVETVQREVGLPTQ